ncbi:MAG: hypothetical protein NZ901_09710 [Geminocystis sp.]|nr:hypothetical protein [Geminocystis sp.]HIK37160.1 hypothetical protein [Geminocystis sp. M7585_C2015_104]MCS7148449.1 hypothetical protein [Geminocystis sp.]MCX8078236.1 hypothetical protein [Geminocystis sp.]MDW8115964.1 hypothetical protein [Geminocystis sp.]
MYRVDLLSTHPQLYRRRDRITKSGGITVGNFYCLNKFAIQRGKKTTTTSLAKPGVGRGKKKAKKKEMQLANRAKS